MSPYRFCLWGHRQGYVQVGSELDRAIWPAWRARLVGARVRADLRAAARAAREARPHQMNRRLDEVAAVVRRLGMSASQAAAAMGGLAESFREANRSLASRSQGRRQAP